jgi:hypothetical protein
MSREKLDDRRWVQAAFRALDPRPQDIPEPPPDLADRFLAAMRAAHEHSVREAEAASLEQSQPRADSGRQRISETVNRPSTLIGKWIQSARAAGKGMVAALGPACAKDPRKKPPA